MTLINTYKHNKAARAYNRTQKPRNPVLVGAAGGAVSGAALSSAFYAASSHERAMRSIGGAIGGAAGGALAGKAKQSFDSRIREHHQIAKGRKVEKLPYF